ncbi:hypothetical protein [Gordonia amarae]|uniref:hypothetical protein n=1 Tax=Gordonia amarae TaxID=36821 RepID=UPI001AFB34CA|nr:hypothetical protein [Gordonia amarae]QHN18070.1 hypothetical protein GII35_14850 [Gordonia amarae]QHN22591.1 hypothetical protein GII34_14590 [Gordonia amarae]
MARIPRTPSRTAGPALALLIMLVGALLAAGGTALAPVPAHAAPAAPRADFSVSGGVVALHVSGLPKQPLTCELIIGDPNRLSSSSRGDRFVHGKTATGFITLRLAPQLGGFPMVYSTQANCNGWIATPNRQFYSFHRVREVVVTPAGGFVL